jgi:fucose permease
VVVGLGEIIGGGIAPSVAGHIAKNYGIEHVFGIALSALIACAAIILFIREPRNAFQVLGQESTSANAG